MRAAVGLGAVLLVLISAGCALVPGIVRRPVDRLVSPRDSFHDIGFLDGSGARTHVLARICRPPAEGRAKLAVLNHAGVAPDGDRAGVVLPGCDSPPARWFLARGYIVVMPLRRGYGATAGAWAANPGPCAAPDYIDAGLEAGRDIDAAIQYASALPYARSDGIVVAGEGEGGWAVLGYAARPNPDVAAMVNMGGGMGGLAGGQRLRTCRPDLLVEAAAAFGRTARNRTLWVYATDDPVFSPELAAGMQAAFVDAGGTADLARPSDVGRDAHAMLFSARGEAIWGGLMTALLQPP